jgi:hypothetical protein
MHGIVKILWMEVSNALVLFYIDSNLLLRIGRAYNLADVPKIKQVYYRIQYIFHENIQVVR